MPERRLQDKLPLAIASWRSETAFLGMDILEAKSFDFRSYHLAIHRKARWHCKCAEILRMCCPALAHTHEQRTDGYFNTTDVLLKYGGSDD
ncbi:hypothetical protein N7489_007575 [Penicillium chrysogenum]|uniref:Uncharacterized protein n=1 Tax=Penicillium chrysogenum TaxID=5076 RepID=A0ABQ8W7I0_PENCH|nr:uncharacterized protein N7489_007575 [Penicillium chrysogenum]KAJ5237484.1 hypothetical protein N7489_007575 [Penicillium chrysogenum]KAJ5256422.1 hypothetical protein N7505_011573 [Penicillium chrysogenum]KAJ5277442.1 hypothetical protein N7524_003595 [Penicillium chrysogenum]KAJ6160185.1 hypothetical protein N7497_004722 [Penicillium chrysogenum]